MPLTSGLPPPGGGGSGWGGRLEKQPNGRTCSARFELESLVQASTDGCFRVVPPNPALPLGGGGIFSGGEGVGGRDARRERTQARPRCGRSGGRTRDTCRPVIGEAPRPAAPALL